MDRFILVRRVKKQPIWPRTENGWQLIPVYDVRSPPLIHFLFVPTLRIGIIGAGGAALGIHLPGLRLCPGVEIAAVCDPDPNTAGKTGVSDVTASYRELLAREDIQAVVNSTPNYMHHEITLEAIARGKHILCEKPLSLDTARATDMLRAAEAAGVVHMTAFTYRYTPALQYMIHLVASGQLGAIRTVRAAYQMALSGHLLGWRSTKAQAGSGVLADIGSHLIHMVELVAGPIACLSATDHRFRDDPASDVEDWSAFLAGFSSGASGIFEISRVCAGRGAGITENLFIEVYGTEGTAVFSLQDPWGLMVSLGESAQDPGPPARPRRCTRTVPENLRLASRRSCARPALGLSLRSGLAIRGGHPHGANALAFVCRWRPLPVRAGCRARVGCVAPMGQRLNAFHPKRGVAIACGLRFE